MKPPAATLISVDKDRAIYMARPNRLGAMLTILVGIALTLLPLALPLLFDFGAGWFVAGLFGVILAAILLPVATSLARARCKVEVMFSTREITMMDSRNDNPLDELVVSFEDVGRLVKIPGGLALEWRSGEQGPRLLSSEPVSRMIERHIAFEPARPLESEAN